MPAGSVMNNSRYQLSCVLHYAIGAIINRDDVKKMLSKYHVSIITTLNRTRRLAKP